MWTSIYTFSRPLFIFLYNIKIRIYQMVFPVLFLTFWFDQIIWCQNQQLAGRVNKSIDWNVPGWFWLAYCDLDMIIIHIANIFFGKVAAEIQGLNSWKEPWKLAFNCLCIFDLISGSIMDNTPLPSPINIWQSQFCPPNEQNIPNCYSLTYFSIFNTNSTRN